MEELSIEEKAKRYDEAIKIAKSKIRNDTDHVLYEKDIVDIFSELKEPEDEKIRKWLIEYFNQYTIDGMPVVFGNSLNVRDIITWLEKQGEQKSTKSEKFECPNIKLNDAIEVSSRMKYIDDDLKPIAEFILDYANWDLDKDKWNQPTITIPLFKVLDALMHRGKPYRCC